VSEIYKCQIKCRDCDSVLPI